MSAATIAAHAAQDAARGAALLRRFANAVATWEPGLTTEGIFERRADQLRLGSLPMAAREVAFEVITAELPAGVGPGTSCTVAMGNAPDVALGPYRVRPGGRTDDLEDATTELLLELA